MGSEKPLVGRGAELARLSAAVERARAGSPAAVLLSGDAGVGKTRLLSELCRQARQSGATVLVGHCVDLGAVGLPYLPSPRRCASSPTWPARTARWPRRCVTGPRSTG